MLTIGIEYALIGALAGTLAGLLGVGGGIIIIPGLFFAFEKQSIIPQNHLMQFVVGTSLAAIIATTLFSLRAQHLRGSRFLPIFSKMVTGVVIGVISGTLLANYLSTHILTSLFGVFMIFVAIQMFFKFYESKHQGLPGLIARNLAAWIIGLFSGLLGISGGALMIPYLIYYKIPIREAMASATACGILIAFTGSLGFMWSGWSNTDHPDWSSGYIYWPAVLMITLFSPLFVKLGNAWSNRLPVETLRKILAVFIFGVGMEMFFHS